MRPDLLLRQRRQFSQEERAIFWKGLGVYLEEGLGSEISLENLSLFIFSTLSHREMLLRSGLKHD